MKKALSKTRVKSSLEMRVLDISLKMLTDRNGMEQIARKIQKDIKVLKYIFEFLVEEKFYFAVRAQSILFVFFERKNLRLFFILQYRF